MGDPTTPRYTSATALNAEGARVDLVICLECGVALLIDPRDATYAKGLHTRWHAQQEKTATHAREAYLATARFR